MKILIFYLLLFNPLWVRADQPSVAQEEELPEEGLIEWAFDELLKPRLPPLTGLDLVLRKHDLIGMHVGEMIYKLAEEQIKQALAKLDQENLNALADATGVPGASWLTTIATLDDGWLLQHILLVASRHWVLPKVGKALSRLTEWTVFKAGAFAIGQAVDVLADPYRQLSRDYLVKFLCSLIRAELPATVLEEILKSIKGQIRSDVAYNDLFEATCNVSDPEKFIEYFDLLTRLDSQQLDRVPLQALDGQPERMRFWQARKMEEALDTYSKPMVFRASLQTLQGELGKMGAFPPAYLQSIDFFVGRSKLFAEALFSTTDDRMAAKAARYLTRFLKLGSDWKALIRANALNLTWLLLRQRGKTLTAAQCLHSAQYGTPAFLSVVLSSGQCDEHVREMQGRTGSPLFTNMTPLRQRRAAHQKALILSAHPEMRSVARRLGGFALCQGRGSAMREIRTRLLHDPERPVIVDKQDMLEVTKAVMVIALRIPSCLLRGIDALPEMEKVADWATAELHHFCQAKKKWPALILQQVQPPPTPRWLRPKVELS